MKFLIIAIFTLLTTLSFPLLSQESNLPKQKGSLYLTWGYHREGYTKSDLHFKNNTQRNYNFTLYNANAADKDDLSDFFQQDLTVPQYTINVGYMLNNKSNTGFELAFDHLKYVVTDDQQLHLKGEIEGVYYDKDTLVSHDFVHLEHTNGNNYVTANFVKAFSLMKKKSGVPSLTVMLKGGGGVLTPKTTSTVLGDFLDAPLNISGWVATASANLRYEFFRYFYLEVGTKGAFVDYTRAILAKEGRAKHTFFSVQYIGAAGITIPLGGWSSKNQLKP